MIIILILLFGFLLRIVSLNQSLWLDEATSVIVARDFSFSEILTKFSPGDFHPPLYYLLLKVWMSVAGSSEVSARSLSILFSLATILFIYILGKRLFTHTVGLLSALLLATAPLYIYYSQEARMYAMETLLATVVVYFVIRIIQSKEVMIMDIIQLTIASAVLLYTDYLPVFFLVSIFVYFFLYHKKHLFYLSLWVGGTAILFVPWIHTFLVQLQNGMGVREGAPLWWSTLGKTNLKEIVLVPVKFVIGRISFFDKVFYGVTVLIASVPFFASFFQSFRQFSKTRILWFWLLGPLILSAIFGVFISGFSYFRLLFVLPAFYLLVAYGALSVKNTQLRKLTISSLVLVNLIASGIYLVNPRFHREDWRGAVSYIEKNSHPNAGVLFVSKNQRDTYHYYANRVPSFGPEGLKLGFDTIWLMRYVQPIFDPKDTLRTNIESKGYTKVSESDFNGVVVWEYKK